MLGIVSLVNKQRDERMSAFTVHVTINGGDYTREIEARSPLAACRKAAKNGGFGSRDISEAYVEDNARMTFLGIRPGITYSVFH